MASEYDLCPDKPYGTFFQGICKRMTLTTCFLNVLQFFLVALMHLNVGKGMYWKILYIASAAGMIGGVCEHATVAYYCTEDRINKPRGYIVFFLINEIFFIVKEYAVPFLNLIKLKAFSEGSQFYKIIKYIIIFFFFIFMGFRFFIGYSRMTAASVVSQNSRFGHAGAFIVTGVADMICTLSILYYVRKHNQQTFNENAPEIGHYIKRSSYIILVFVDIVSFVLGILNAVTEISKGKISSSYIDPLQCIKTSFILILACDALVFKYSVNYSMSSTSKEISNKEFFSSNYHKPITKNYTHHPTSRTSMKENNNYKHSHSQSHSHSRSQNHSQNQSTHSNSNPTSLSLNYSNLHNSLNLTKVSPVFSFSQHSASSCNPQFSNTLKYSTTSNSFDNTNTMEITSTNDNTYRFSSFNTTLNNRNSIVDVNNRNSMVDLSNRNSIIDINNNNNNSDNNININNNNNRTSKLDININNINYRHSMMEANNHHHHHNTNNIRHSKIEFAPF